jgi:sulfhydrogenase subunit beta (sulfur reductase)
LKSIKIDDLDHVITLLFEAGYRVIAPIREKEFTLFREITNTRAVDFSEIQTRNSIKEFFFPMNETLFSYRKNGNDIEYVPDINRVKQQKKVVIIGSRPCDAASLVILAKLFNWDYRDDFFNRRLKKTSLISIACERTDNTCFCTSVGGAPDNPAGSDILFKKAGNSYQVDCLSDKGKSIMKLMKPLFGNDGSEPKPVPLKRKFNSRQVETILRKNFENPFFGDVSLKCLQCGICAYLCPTCHCFDIIDEGTRNGGDRFRNYDSCQFASFTIHTSNHNPRPDRASRWRNRIMHKFVYFPHLFNVTGCVGCGRCFRNCPVGMNMAEQLENISRWTGQT